MDRADHVSWPFVYQVAAPQISQFYYETIDIFPQVRWIRVLYSDFAAFTRDQEYLISLPKNSTFDYVEGFVIVNNEGLLNNWRSSYFSPQNPVKVSSLDTKGRVLYCLEMTKNYNEHDALHLIDEV